EFFQQRRTDVHADRRVARYVLIGLDNDFFSQWRWCQLDVRARHLGQREMEPSFCACESLQLVTQQVISRREERKTVAAVSAGDRHAVSLNRIGSESDGHSGKRLPCAGDSSRQLGGRPLLGATWHSDQQCENGG